MTRLGCTVLHCAIAGAGMLLATGAEAQPTIGSVHAACPASPAAALVQWADAVPDQEGLDDETGQKRVVKHTPGRDHAPKSGGRKKKRFQRKAAKKRQARANELRKQWDEWDNLPSEVQKLLAPNKKPKR